MRSLVVDPEQSTYSAPIPQFTNWEIGAICNFMKKAKTFASGDLAAFRGVDQDALKFWFREGLLLPLPTEPGKHRRFSAEEAKIAAVLGEARAQGLNVHALRQLAPELRKAQQFRAELRARLGGAPALDQELSAISAAEKDIWNLGHDLETCTGGLGIFCDDADQWRVSSARGSGARAEVYFNLGPILESFRRDS
jgi:DNA-binding transcriptional MerR regulator